MSGRELAVRDALRELCVEVFCPCLQVQHRRLMTRAEVTNWRAKHPDSKKRAGALWTTARREEAALPAYLFARSYECEPLRLVRGVLDVVRCGGMPVAVSACVIDAMRREAGEDDRVTRATIKRWFKGAVGDEFVIEGGGAWSGHVARIASLDRLDKHNKILALVSLFGRMTEVELDVGMVGRAISGSQITAVAA